MTLSGLDSVALAFRLESEALHDRFLAIKSDVACGGCQSAGFGEAILTAWLQTKWITFNRGLVVASARGTRRTRASRVQAIAGVRSQADAEKTVRAAATDVTKKRGDFSPVWHSTDFVIEVSSHMRLSNLPRIEAALGPTIAPAQVTAFRNYLVHRDERARLRYENLQAKLGMLHVEPEDLLHRETRPGLPVFTSWVRELQGVAYDATQ